MTQLTIQEAFNLATALHQAGQLEKAEKLYRQIIAQEPNHAAALHYLGAIVHQAGRNDVAVDLIRQSLKLNPNNAEAYFNLGIVLKSIARFAESIAAFRQAVAVKPDLAVAHFNLGIALATFDQLDEAIAAYRKAIMFKPDYVEAYINLGAALNEKRQWDDAIAVCRQAISLNGELAAAHNNLGDALRGKGKIDDAIGSLRQAILLKPDLAQAYYGLGNALREKGKLNDAVASWRQAIFLKPDLPEAHYNLGNAYKDAHRLDDAIAAYQQAIAIKPNYVDALSNLADSLGRAGQVDQAVAALRRAVALKPDYPEIHSNLTLAMHYHPAYDAQAIAEEHRRWNQLHAEPLRQFIQPHRNDRNPERQLRIGYVSPDFREHAVAPMVLPLLLSSDRENFEVFCYAEVLKPDAMTERFRAAASHWCNTYGLSDEQVATLIRQDQIDILVDLAGHTAGNRLLVFARKPAPVQVTRQGYPNTTGLETIDYRMSDAWADPPGLSDTLHSEQLVRLPQTNWIYKPPENCPLPDHQSKSGPITFGCFNNFAKVTEPMLGI